MTERRNFVKLLAASGASLLVPEWLLDPLKGHSMVTVPQFPIIPSRTVTYFVDPGKSEDYYLTMESSRDGLSWNTAFQSMDEALDVVGNDGATIYCRGSNVISGRTVKNVHVYNKDFLALVGCDISESYPLVESNGCGIQSVKFF